MPKPIPTLRSVALGVLRRVRGWTGRELAQAAAVSETMVSYYESGHRCPSHKVLLALADTMGFSPDEVSCVLFGLAGVASPSDPTFAKDLTAEERREIRQHAVSDGLAAAKAAEEKLLAEAERLRADEERRVADGRFRQLLKLSEPQREACLDGCGEGLDWALVERVCRESERAAASDPAGALAWGNLALRVAERVRGSAALRGRVQGYAWAFIGNARRVASDLPGADEAFGIAWKLWRRGQALADAPLGEWYLYDMEASLRRDQRLRSQAIHLHQAALIRADRRTKGIVLLNLSTTQMVFGEPRKAVAALTEAAPLVDAESEPRLFFALRFNLAANLNQVSRAHEAKALLPEIRDLATRLRNEIDLARTLWLQAHIDLNLGLRQEALCALAQVRRDFARRELAYDTALVALEEALLYLEDGALGRVREIATEILWVFRSQGVDREGLATLRLFCLAAQREEVSLALGRSALAVLRDLPRKALDVGRE